MVDEPSVYLTGPQIHLNRYNLLTCVWLSISFFSIRFIEANLMVNKYSSNIIVYSSYKLLKFKCFFSPVVHCLEHCTLLNHVTINTTSVFILFLVFFTFYQIFLSIQVKRSVIISNKMGIYKSPHELPSNLTSQ